MKVSTNTVRLEIQSAGEEQITTARWKQLQSYKNYFD